MIKTEEISNITSKLIFSLTTSDVLITLTSQCLLAVILHTKYCSFKVAFIFLSVLFYNFGSYIVAFLGVDSYHRIKYYSNFRSIWTTKVATTLIIVMFFLIYLQALMITLSSTLEESKIVLSFYVTIDGITIGMVPFLKLILSKRQILWIINQQLVFQIESIRKW